MKNQLDRWAKPVLALPRFAKCVLVFASDVSFCVIAVWFSFYLRLGEFVSLSGKPLWAIAISLGLALPTFMVLGLYRSVFRYSGWPAMLAVARATAIYGIFYGSIITAIGIAGIPRTIGLIQPLLLVVAVGGSRVLARYWLGGLYRSRLQIASLPKTLIYGAGRAGCQLAAALNNSFEMRVVGFLDDNQQLHGHVLNRLPIFSPDSLGDLIESKEIADVLLAIPSATRRRRNEILERIAKHPVSVRTLPSLNALADGRVTTSDLRELDIDDLIAREQVTPDPNLLSKNITGKVVLVTGAGGSIGSGLCRQILNLRPARLLLVEMSEFALYSTHSELENQCLASDDARILESDLDRSLKKIVPLLASVQDKERMQEIMKTWNPSTIYHAAAYKHVPMVEYNLSEGIWNNVFGTLTMAEVAVESGVSDFVLISTDKAVRPTNVMGASKRLAEMCLQAQHQKYQGQGKTKFSMVRFGNVLGSSGSVIPKFRQQIRDGGPITLTHLAITRFFMTISEAVQLVIQAGAMAKGGGVFVLDMGAPVKIQDLARRMVELSGLSLRDENNPDGDIELAVSGLRPGEKLYEELLLGDDPQPTSHPRIMRAQDPCLPWDKLEAELATLRQVLTQNNVDLILTVLGKLVPDYKPSGEIMDWVYREQLKKPKNPVHKESV